jgi:Xrn1 helical domain
MDYSGCYYIIIAAFLLGLGFIDTIIPPKLPVTLSRKAGLTKDVRKGFKVDMTFDQAEPFKPFQQLMGVLPSRSRKLLPEAYRVRLEFLQC